MTCYWKGQLQFLKSEMKFYLLYGPYYLAVIHWQVYGSDDVDRSNGRSKQSAVVANVIIVHHGVRTF